jgi:hypothetical protein
MRTAQLVRCGAVTSALLLAAPTASAQKASGQQGAAEALFEQASQLVDAGRITEACEKFAASQELDPGLGTQLHLADCYDRAGRSASAWALFREVEERSHRENQLDRERIAGERATALEPKLSRLELRVQRSRQVPGLSLTLAGASVPKASWNVALPIDPGSVRLEASAPGRRAWSLQIEVAPGPGTRVVELPQLAAAPVSAPAERAASPDTESNDGSSRRMLGLLTGGTGLVALAAGGFFGYRAYALNQSSKAECRADAPTACTQHGTSLREDATAAARLSTIASVSGAVLVVGGITLVVTAPSPLADKHPSQSADNSNWQLQLRGVW